jgi:outer membrane receptor protein involved in Fe transport
MRFANAGSFSFIGAEAALDARFGPLRARCGYAYLDPGVHTRARPGSKLDAGVGLSWHTVEVDLKATHISRYFAADSSRQEIPAYMTVDARASYSPFDWLTLTAATENVLDKEYVTYADLPGSGSGLYEMPGRSFTMGLELKR